MNLKDWQTYSTPEQETIFSLFPVCRSYSHLMTRSGTSQDLGETIRLSKTRDFLNSVFAEFYRTSPTPNICLSWSQATEDRLAETLAATFANPRGWAVFVYGKLGSRELNLSSDVDLVFISEREFTPGEMASLRQFRALISDSTDSGFGHRLDFDLRAGGRMGPLVATFEQWQDYFSNYGEAWERLTFIRFRAIWGDEKLREKVLKEADRLTFRKYLDFSLIEEFKDLRQKIHEQNWRRSGDDSIDLKLGIGGIRDLELFVHTLQVIYGGKSIAVRTSSTSDALQQLAQINALQESDRAFLYDHYWQMRHFENLVQGYGDEQTHILKPSLMAGSISEREIIDLRAAMKRCHELVSTLLGPLDEFKKSLPASPESQKEWLLSLNVKEEVINTLWPQLFSHEVLSRQRERDDRMRRLFVFRFLGRSFELGLDVNIVLPRLAELIQKIRAKAALFHMLVNKPQTLDRLCHLLASSQYFSQILIHRPELLDSFVLERQDSVTAHMDVEAKAIHWRERRLLAELLGGLDFLKDHNVGNLSIQLTRTADSIVSELLGDLKKEFHSSVDLLALGKWGGRELGLNSDLDFILVTGDTPSESDLKLGRRFLNRLTGGESIYQVDLRLKPHGGSGLMITSFPDLLTFLQQEAPPWQRQSYLKARSLFSLIDVDRLYQVCVTNGLSNEDLANLKRIQKDLIEQNKSSKALDVKYVAGGLLDIELAVQASLLFHRITPSGPALADHFQALQKNFNILTTNLPKGTATWDVAGVQKLYENYRHLRRIEQLLRLREDPVEIAKLLKTDENSLRSEIQRLLGENFVGLECLDPRRRAG